MALSESDVAELIVGIARAQQQLVVGLATEFGKKDLPEKLIPYLDALPPNPSLLDLPSHVLRLGLEDVTILNAEAKVRLTRLLQQVRSG